MESAGGDETKVQIPKFTFLNPFTNFGSDMNLGSLPAAAENVALTNEALSKAFNTNVVTSFSFSEEASEEMHRVAGIATGYKCCRAWKYVEKIHRTIWYD